MDTQSARMVEVYLEGGPAYFPAEMRHRQASTADYKIKLEYCGGHEHFERVTRQGAGDVPVIFRWTGTTRIAE
jgi:uncharacterized protein DUF5988